jgi:hypothetical protein
MKIWRADQEAMAFSDFNPLTRNLLHRIVASADPEDHPDVLGRLYSTPTAGKEPEFDEEWQELVGRDLRDHFEGAIEVVRRDLTRLSPEESRADEVFRIPISHLESWVNALNQARLAIAARHGFTERELEGVPPENHPHTLPLFQMHFYGLLQERFIRELEES